MTGRLVRSQRKLGLTMAGVPEDLTGKQFGRLLAEGVEAGPGRAKWRCRCLCGNRAVVAANDLKAGRQVSCGCVRRENYAAYIRDESEGSLPKNTPWWIHHPVGVALQDARRQAWLSQLPFDPDWNGDDLRHWRKLQEDLPDAPPYPVLHRVDESLGWVKGNCYWGSDHDHEVHRVKTPIVLSNEDMTRVARARRASYLYDPDNPFSPLLLPIVGPIGRAAGRGPDEVTYRGTLNRPPNYRLISSYTDGPERAPVFDTELV